MSDELEKTSPVVTLRSVLAIHCSAEFLRRCVDAAARARMTLRECDLHTMGRNATQRPPTAMIVPSYLHEFDPYEFEALARDVGAVLLVVDEDLAPPALDALLADVGVRRERSPRPTQGRYFQVGGCATEVTRVSASSNTRDRLRVDRSADDDDVEPITSRTG